MRRITLVGVGPGGVGRDLDALAAAMDAFAKRPKGTAFDVPTPDPSGLLGAWGDRHQIWPVGVRLRNGSLGVVGPAAFRSVARTDLTLLVGDLRENGPLRSLGWLGVTLLLAAARRARRPVAAFALGVGPLRSQHARAAARALLRRCGQVVVRDDASLRAVEALGVGAVRSSDPDSL